MSDLYIVRVDLLVQVPLDADKDHVNAHVQKLVDAKNAWPSLIIHQTNISVYPFALPQSEELT